jgi:uncharacterized membrane protein
VRTAAWSVTLVMLASAPLALVQMPLVEWRTDAVLAVVALGAVDSALGYLLFYRLVRDAGPTRASQVNYMLPIIAVMAGTVFLSETIALVTLAAMLVILLGVWLSERGSETAGSQTAAAQPPDMSRLIPVSGPAAVPGPDAIPQRVHVAVPPAEPALSWSATAAPPPPAPPSAPPPPHYQPPAHPSHAPAQHVPPVYAPQLVEVYQPHVPPPTIPLHPSQQGGGVTDGRAAA